MQARLDGRTGKADGRQADTQDACVLRVRSAREHRRRLRAQAHRAVAGRSPVTAVDGSGTQDYRAHAISRAYALTVLARKTGSDGPDRHSALSHVTSTYGAHLKGQDNA